MSVVGASRRAVNLPKGQIAQALKLLELDGAVARDGSRYRRTPNPWQQDEERIERVMAARRPELAQMQAYMRHDGCLHGVPRRELLDDPAAAPCGRCANDVGRGLPREVDPERVRAAVSFLRRDLRTIKPRLLWPTDAVPGLSGKITPPNEIGLRAVRLRRRRVGDATVQRGKDVDGRVLAASSSRPRRGRSAIGGGRQPAPDLGHGDPVGRAARDRRRVRPVAGGASSACRTSSACPCSHGAPPQKAMQNSAQQLRNAHAQARHRGRAGSDGAGPAGRRHRRIRAGR